METDYTFSTPQEDRLLDYHYCSVEAFYNIITCGKIRLFNLLEMNDPSELSLLKFDIVAGILDALRDAASEITISNGNEKIGIEKYLRSSSFNEKRQKVYNTYFAFCLSREANSLSQWRLYGQNGKGFCLGFSFIHLCAQRVTKHGYFFNTVKYIDDFENQFRKTAEIVSNKIKQIYRMGNNDELIKYLDEEMNDFLIEESFKYKHIAYHYENERRLICSKSIKTDNEINCNDVCSVMRNGMISSCVEIPLDELGLTSVTTGPLNNSAKASIHMFLQQNGVSIKAENINHSTIPYRAN